jgi:ubiquinone biosynthesis protein UbiJ
MKTLILNGITEAVNQVLKHGDPLSRERLKTLSDTSIAFCLSPFTVKFEWRVIDGRLILKTNPETPSDCEFSGDFFSFLRAITSKHPASLFQRGEMKMQGDLHAAERWFTFFRELNLDWEAVLQPFLGEFASARAASLTNRILEEKRLQFQDFFEDVKHYAEREKGWIPSVSEVRTFMDEVDELSLAEARLSERIQRFFLKN